MFQYTIEIAAHIIYGCAPVFNFGDRGSGGFLTRPNPDRAGSGRLFFKRDGFEFAKLKLASGRDGFLDRFRKKKYLTRLAPNRFFFL